MSHLEYIFLLSWSEINPDLELLGEVRVSKKRKFRFDFAHPQSKVAFEIHGGRWIKSGHTTGKGLKRDYDKLNLAMLEGWRVFQLCDASVDDFELMKTLGDFVRSQMED